MGILNSTEIDSQSFLNKMDKVFYDRGLTEDILRHN